MIVDNVTRRFGGLTAVDVDHLEIPRGAITALIGPNGAGKTTLFNLLCGFDKPNTGTWSFDGNDALRHPGLQGRAHGTGAHVPADQGAVAAHGAREHEARRDEAARRAILDELHPRVLAQRRTPRSRPRRASCSQRFKLDAKEKDFAASLSGGQRKLLEMARALMSDPHAGHAR